MNKKVLFRRYSRRILDSGHKYGVRSVKLFGSVVRGQERPNSDIDFLVEMDPGRSLFDLGGFQMELEEMLNRKVDVVTAKGLRERLRRKVLDEAVAL